MDASNYITASIAPDEDDMVFELKVKNTNNLINRESSTNHQKIRSNRVSANMREMESKQNPFRPAVGTAGVDQSEYNLNMSDLYESQIAIIDSKRSGVAACCNQMESKISSIQQGITKRQINIIDGTNRQLLPKKMQMVKENSNRNSRALSIQSIYQGVINFGQSLNIGTQNSAQQSSSNQSRGRRVSSSVFRNVCQKQPVRFVPRPVEPLDKKKKKTSFLLIDNPDKNEENLSSSEDSLSEKQQDAFFNETTKFIVHQTPEKHQYVSFLIDESTTSKKRNRFSIHQMIVHEDELQGDNHRSMTLTSTEIQRLKNEGLSPYANNSTDEQEELNNLIEEQEPVKKSDTFQSFKNKVNSSQKSSTFLSMINGNSPAKIFPSSLEEEVEIQHINLQLEHQDFTTFRRKSYTPPSGRSSKIGQNPEVIAEPQNLIESLKQVQNEKSIKQDENKLKITPKQANLLVAVIKGYKTRKLLRNNEEIKHYISEIKNLMKTKDDYETQISLKTKKHIFIHTFNSLSRMKRHSKKQAKQANGPTSISENILMKQYLDNQKNSTVKISFKHLFDSQSRFKILPKKTFKYRSNEDEKTYNSNISFKNNTSPTENVRGNNELVEGSKIPVSSEGSISSDEKLMDVDTNQIADETELTEGNEIGDTYLLDLEKKLSTMEYTKFDNDQIISFI